VVGRTDGEDALRRLENLTHDEVLMTTAQVLKATDNVDDKVTGIHDEVKDISDNVRAATNEVNDIGDNVRVVIDGV
jgi:hypothetical protein